MPWAPLVRGTGYATPELKIRGQDGSLLLHLCPADAEQRVNLKNLYQQAPKRGGFRWQTPSPGRPGELVLQGRRQPTHLCRLLLPGCYKLH